MVEAPRAVVAQRASWESLEGAILGSPQVLILSQSLRWHSILGGATGECDTPGWRSQSMRWHRILGIPVLWRYYTPYPTKQSEVLHTIQHNHTTHHTTHHILHNRQRYYVLVAQDDGVLELHKIGFDWPDEEAPKNRDTKWQTCTLDRYARTCKFAQGFNLDGYSLQDGFMAQAPSSYHCDS